MPDRLLVPLPDGRWLSLTPQAFAQALCEGSEAVKAPAPSSAGTSVEPLLDPEQAAVALGVSARLLEDYARLGIAPHYKLGRSVRFRVSEVAAHFQVAGAPLPTDSLSVTPIRRLARQ
jgi:hypothetical protein